MYGTIFDQYVHANKKGRRLFTCGLLGFPRDYGRSTDHGCPADTQVCATVTAQIGAMPVKDLFCHSIRFHGAAIMCLFTLKVKLPALYSGDGPGKYKGLAHTYTHYRNPVNGGIVPCLPGYGYGCCYPARPDGAPYAIGHAR